MAALAHVDHQLVGWLAYQLKKFFCILDGLFIHTVWHLRSIGLVSRNKDVKVQAASVRVRVVHYDLLASSMIWLEVLHEKSLYKRVFNFYAYFGRTQTKTKDMFGLSRLSISSEDTPIPIAKASCLYFSQERLS